LARHQYGCRVLERLIEHFPGAWLEDFTDGILQDGMSLCRNNYGNFVMQHLLEHGLPEVRQRIVQVLASDIANVATHQHACGVLDSALSYAALEDQHMLAKQVLDSSGLLITMVGHRGGIAAIQRLLRVGGDGLRAEAQAQIAEGAQELQLTKPGRAILASILPQIYGAPENSAARLAQGDKALEE